MELEDSVVLLDGFDSCILGITEEFGGRTRVLYSKDKIIEELVNQGMTYEESIEYYEFNILGLYVSEQNPIFLQTNL